MTIRLSSRPSAPSNELRSIRAASWSDVANPINLQPQATATEQGTLLCPFPEPVLAIASAVLLSWPAFEEGYVVEIAPTPDGPWTPSDATPFLEAGQTCIAVATTGEQQFFRLRQP